MRAAVIFLVACSVAHADAPKRTAPAGFDHPRHAQATALACTQCHPLERGVIAKPPTHATCFGKCHAEQVGALKLRDAVADPRYCIGCHAETALSLPIDTKALARTAVTTGADHALQLGHAAHGQIACAKCHDMARPNRGLPHARCVGCHGDKPETTFAISECAKCHPPGTDRPRFARDSQVVVTSAFSHTRHATRGAAKQCLTCHAGVAATNTRTLPTPKLETCTTAGCHDAKAAFGAMTACTRCHRDVPKGEFLVARPAALFSHANHAPLTKAKAPCASCHPLSKTGEIQVAGHLACVDGCHDHEADFGARAPKICGACHDGTEPWRPLIADKIPTDTTEFGATLDHRKHAGACTSCHTLTTTRTELRPPRGHRSCTTAGCHAVTAGPAPRMTACESCHQAGAAATRESARLTARWSVRATFKHRVHGQKIAVDCVKCHTDLTSPTVLSLAPPPKAACSASGCHDGGAAFKVTGTSCTRCHPGSPK